MKSMFVRPGIQFLIGAHEKHVPVIVAIESDWTSGRLKYIFSCWKYWALNEISVFTIWHNVQMQVITNTWSKPCHLKSPRTIHSPCNITTSPKGPHVNTDNIQNTLSINMLFSHHSILNSTLYAYHSGWEDKMVSEDVRLYKYQGLGRFHDPSMYLGDT